MELSEEFQDLNGWDWAIRSFDGSTLVIIGGISSSLYEKPSTTITFGEVAYIECASQFSHLRMRKGRKDDVEKIGRKEAIEEGTLFVLEAETGAFYPQVFYILADDIRIVSSDDAWPKQFAPPSSRAFSVTGGGTPGA